MDSLFDNFFRGFDIEPFESRLGDFSPRVDVTETDKEIKTLLSFRAWMKKDIDVSLQNDMLTIKGEKKEEKEDKGKDYYKMERSYGSFSRTIPLPIEVETDKVEAKFKKGVLSINASQDSKGCCRDKEDSGKG